MRISTWISDVCSSDLAGLVNDVFLFAGLHMLRVKHASRTDSRRILQPLLEPRPIEFAAGVIQIRPLSFPQTIEIKLRRLGQRVTARALPLQDVVTSDSDRKSVV